MPCFGLRELLRTGSHSYTIGSRRSAIDCWHHGSGRDNPADIPTRVELVKSNLWHGLPWLGEEINLNSSDLSDMPNECMVELKSNQQSVELVIMEDFGISKVIQIKDYSDLNKLLGVTAHVIMVIIG